jgi:hypothetical protein
MGSAYTNNFATASTTSLYGIDANSDSLYLSSNPNGGTYGLVGPLGLDAIANLGFDIGGDGIAFAAIQTQTQVALRRSCRALHHQSGERRGEPWWDRSAPPGKTSPAWRLFSSRSRRPSD